MTNQRYEAAAPLTVPEGDPLKVSTRGAADRGDRNVRMPSVNGRGGETGAAAGMGLDYARTFAIGFGMMAICAAWALYNAYVPIKLKDLGLGTATVGIIMGVDNVFGLSVQPLFGILSDSVRTRWGRRLPFALVAAPACAAALVLIAVAPGVSSTVVAVVAYAVLMSTWRAPIVALMPDVTPSPLRSKANGIINFMGSIGSVAALAGGSLLYGRFGMSAAFGAGALIMLIAIVSLGIMVREPPEFVSGPGARGVRLPTWAQFRSSILPAVRFDASTRRSFILILVVLFSYSVGGNAVETYFTLYATHDLHMKPAAAGVVLTFYAIGAILFAIAAGSIGNRIGRRPTMSIGLVCCMAIFIPMTWMGSTFLVIPVALAFGILWTLVFVNALPWITQLGGVESTGTMTAYYYLATAGGAAISPLAFGLIQQATGEYRWMFLYAAGFFLVALVCMPFIRHGEAPGTLPA